MPVANAWRSRRIAGQETGMTDRYPVPRTARNAHRPTGWTATLLAIVSWAAIAGLAALALALGAR